MLSAYMGDPKYTGDANNFYFPYPSTMPPNHPMTSGFSGVYGIGTLPPPPPYPNDRDENCAPERDKMSGPSNVGPSGMRKSGVPMDDNARKKYRERRDKNNLAAKKSRSNRREREKLMQRKVEELEKENEALRAQLFIYTQQLDYAKKEYERQLALSYTARHQGTILRDNTTNLLLNNQSTLMYPQFPQQPAT